LTYEGPFSWLLVGTSACTEWPSILQNQPKSIAMRTHRTDVDVLEAILSTVQTVDIISSEFRANPSFFSGCGRAAGLSPMQNEKTPIWLVTRYDDVNALLKDERFAKIAAAP
jgi:cytochrome P450